MDKTIILNKEDINNSLHSNLWDSFLETLGISSDRTEICLELSSFDEEYLKRENRIKVKDRVSLASNTSLVCGIVTEKDGYTSFVEWDDNLYYGRFITEGWYEDNELEKVD